MLTKKINKEKVLLTSILLLLIFTGGYLNRIQQSQIDQTKIPRFVENDKNFQKWITNHKNKGINLEADTFKLDEENEVYNTMRLAVYPVNDLAYYNLFKQELAKYAKIEDVRFSPNNEQIVDYRFEPRVSMSGRTYSEQDLLYLGIRNDRIIENKIFECSKRDSCIIDRAYFIDDNTIVASTFALDSRPGNKNPVPCTYDMQCDYIVELYVINIATNSALVYYSPTFNLILNEKIPGF